MILAPSGGIIDDLIVTRIAEDQFLIVANAGNRDAVRAALTERLDGFDAELVELDDALIAVQGPRAREILENTAGLVARRRARDGPHARIAAVLHRDGHALR